MFEIICEKLHHPLNHWIHYSDGRGTQFKSGYVVADMLHATENYQVKSVSFNYFESHEGKSCSDSIGSIVKCLFTRGMLKSQQAVSNIDDILAVIQNESKQFTKKFDFFIVEKVGWFQKRLANSRESCKIDGIMALHSLKFDGHKIILRDLTCSECSIDAFYNDCKTLNQIEKQMSLHQKKLNTLI